MLHLFDALVRPVMLYGVETWGPGALCGAGMEACGVVHRQFLRRLLGVRAGTPCAAVLGEVGRFPVAHTAVLLLCRYWNRLVAMPDTRLTKQAFLESVLCWDGGRQDFLKAVVVTTLNVNREV